jgi:hypothetical protein
MLPLAFEPRAGNQWVKIMSRLETSNRTNNALPIAAEPVSEKIHDTRTVAVLR